MKCYFCFTVPNEQQTEQIYFDMLKVAISSALANTELSLIVLYDGPINCDVYRYLVSQPVTLIKHSFSKANKLRKIYPEKWMNDNLGRVLDYRKLSGTFMRFDIPFIEKDDDYVLYCDIDVVFYKNISFEQINFPKFILAGPEFEKKSDNLDYFNAGVLLINVKSCRKIFDDILVKIENEKINETNLFDQGYLNDAFKDLYEILPLEYNWKPYWGYNKDAAIVHFHGMKPLGDNKNSGFAMNDDVYNIIFKDFDSDVAGYIIYNKEFFKYLYGSKSCVEADLWLSNHINNIYKKLSIKKQKLIFQESVNPRFKDVKLYFKLKISKLFKCFR